MAKAVMATSAGFAAAAPKRWEHDHRCASPEKREAALAHYLEGVGLRATERLVGVSHNSVMNWVLAAVKDWKLPQPAAETVEWIEADELWTYVAQKNDLLALVGC